MASQQELNRQKEYLANQERINKAKEKQREIDSDNLGISSGLVDSIKEIQGISTRRTTFDQNILKINKEINKEIAGQKSGLSDISTIQKQIAKNEDTILKAQKVFNGLVAGLSEKEKKRVKYANDRANDIAKEQAIQDDILDKIAQGENLSEKELKSLNAKLQSSQKRQENAERLLGYHTDMLSPMGKQAVFTKQNEKALEVQNKKREKELKQQEEIEKKLGVFGGLLKGISKIPLIGDLVDTNKILKKAKKEVKATGSGVAGLGAGLKEAGKQIMKAFTDHLTILIAI